MIFETKFGQTNAGTSSTRKEEKIINKEEQTMSLTPNKREKHKVTRSGKQFFAI